MHRYIVAETDGESVDVFMFETYADALAAVLVARQKKASTNRGSCKETKVKGRNTFLLDMDGKSYVWTIKERQTAQELRELKNKKCTRSDPVRTGNKK